MRAQRMNWEPQTAPWFEPDEMQALMAFGRPDRKRRAKAPSMGWCQTPIVEVEARLVKAQAAFKRRVAFSAALALAAPLLSRWMLGPSLGPHSWLMDLGLALAVFAALHIRARKLHAQESGEGA
jgi:hypothetical protein